MFIFKKKKSKSSTESEQQPASVTEYKPAPTSRKVSIPFCKCDEDDQDLVEDDCDSNKGCGKSFSFCGNCFKLVKQKGVDQCSCAFAKRRLELAEAGDYGQI